MKRFIMLFLVVTLTVSLGFMGISCKGVEEEAVEAVEEVTEEAVEAVEEVTEEVLSAEIEIWHWQPGENYKKALDEIMALFKADHPTWTLDMFQTMSGGSDYETLLAARTLTDEFPTLFGFGSPGSGLLEYHTKLVDITDAINSDPEWTEWVKGWIDHPEWQVDGRTYGVPIDKWTVGLWYWKDISEELGIQEPKTMDDLVKLAKTLKDGGYIPIAAGLQTINLTTSALANLVGQLGYIGVVQAEKGEIKWNNPDFLKCLTVLDDIYKAGMYREDALQQGYGVVDLPTFQAKEAWCLWSGGDFFAGSIDEKDLENVVVIPMPLIEPSGQSCFISGVGQNFCMPYNIDETTKKVTMAFLKFLSSPEASKVFLDNSITAAGAIPENYIFTNPILKQTMEKGEELSQYVIDPNVYNGDIFNKLGELTTAMYLGQMTPEEVLQDMDEFMTTIEK